MEPKPETREHRMLGRPTLQEAGKIANRLTDAGWAVLVDLGPEKFSFDEVARRAKASKKTIYARWPNKRSFLNAILSERLHILFESLAAELRASRVPRNRYLAWLAEVGFNILTSPEGRTIERLVDWLDVTAEDDEAWHARKISFDQVLDFMNRLLRQDPTFSVMPLETRNALVHMWIDGIIGRTRTVPRPEAAELAKWSEAFSRYFSLLLVDMRLAGAPEPTS